MVALALSVRLSNMPDSFTSHGTRFIESDAFYHMRRIQQVASGSFSAWAPDMYMNYPAGMHCNWPPLFDLSMGLVARAISGDYDYDATEKICSLTPPFIGSLTVIAILLLGGMIGGCRVAFLAGAFFLAMPYPVQVAVTGRTDHHVAVCLLACIFLAFFLMAFRSTQGVWPVIGSFGAGITLALCMLIWVGSVLFAGLALLICMILVWIDRKRPELSKAWLVRGALFFITAAACLLPYGMRAGWLPWEYLSAFHVVILLASTSVVLCWRIVLMRFFCGSRLTDKTINLLTFLSLGLAVFFAGLVAFPLYDGVKGWLWKSSQIMRHVDESLAPSIAEAITNYSLMLVVYPFVLAGIVWKRAETQNRHMAVVAIVLYVGLMGISFLQERFSDIGSCLAACLSAQSVVYFQDHFPKLVQSTARKVVFVCIVVLLLYPQFRWINHYGNIGSRGTDIMGDAYEVCLWLKNNTPQTTGYDEGNIRPEYSVLAEWQFGHAITYIAQRPNVANNFVGWKVTHEYNILPYRFFAETDPRVAEGTLKSAGVRYIIVGESVISGGLARIIDVLGGNQGEYFRQVAAGDSVCFEPTAKSLDCIVNRLYLQNGAGLNGYKLVYQSRSCHPVNNQLMPRLKVFSYVPNSQ